MLLNLMSVFVLIEHQKEFLRIFQICAITENVKVFYKSNLIKQLFLKKTFA